MKKVFIILGFLLCSLIGESQDFYSINEGMDWTTNSAWSSTSGGAPCTCSPPFQVGAGDRVFIETNVTLNGNLRLKNGSEMKITPADTLWVNGDAQFDNGSKLVIELTGALIISGNLDNNNNSDSIIIHGYLSVGGDFHNGSGADITGNGEIEVGGTVDNDGTIGGSTSDSLSDGSLGDGSFSDPLPIELVFFTAKIDEYENVKIEWLSGSEINNDYYELYRMYDDKWVVIETIPGAGNSSSPILYSTTDYEVPGGVNYYKLRQVDYDGNSETFHVISVYKPYDSNKDMLVYPNPAPVNKKVNVELVGFRGEEILIVVLDVHGKLFYEKAVVANEGGTIIVIDSSLPAGTYIVVGSERHELYRKKLLIQ